jgi:hypothetical protein
LVINYLKGEKNMESTLTENFLSLIAGNIVEFTPNIKTIPVVEYKIQGTGTLVAQNLKSGQLVPKGESYPFFVLDESKILFKRSDGFYFFDRCTTLLGESAKEFYPHAVEFGKRGQVPGSYSFNWQEMKLTFVDIGYLIYQHLSGNCYLGNQTSIRYIIAQLDNGDRFYLEDCKNGTDRYWLGKFLGSDLEQNILSIT